jgi:hypothetical protein
MSRSALVNRSGAWLLSHWQVAVVAAYWASCGVDSQEVGGVAHGAARCPLDEEDGSEAAQGLGAGAELKRCEVLLMPVLFQERGDVLGAVAAGADGGLGPPEAGAPVGAGDGCGCLPQVLRA